MGEKWSTFRALPRILRRSLLLALLLLPPVKLILHWRGLAGTQRLLAALPLPLPLLKRPCPSPEPADVARMTASAAAILPWDIACLPRALVTSLLLTRMGVSCELRLGVVRDKGGIPDAHAWVEHQGQILDSMPEETRRFEAFRRVPSQPDSPAFQPAK